MQHAVNNMNETLYSTHIASVNFEIFLFNSNAMFVKEINLNCCRILAECNRKN